MKASSNSGGVKNMLLQHAEKMVLGVAVILVALFLWSAMGVKPIDASKSPDQLKTQAESEIARISQSTYKEPPSVQADFDSAVQAGLVAVDVTPYTHPTPIDPATRPAITKRPEAALYAVEDLRVTGTVMSVAQEGVTPVWKETTKDAKKSAKKAEPKATNLDGESRKRPPVSRKRNAESAGYGATAPAARGPQAVGRPNAKGAGGDMDHAGYGATGGQSGYGATGPAKGRPSMESREGGYGATYGGGYGGAGAFAGGKPGVQISGNANVQGVVHAAVVLSGRVPYGKQFDEFRKKFKDAASPEMRAQGQDDPIYTQFKIERQEVTAAGESPWKALDVDTALKEEGRWAIAAATETVDLPYLDQVLAWPMPPAIQRDWNRLASHPSVPMQWMAADMTQMQLTPRGEQDIEALKAARSRTTAPTTGYGFDGRMQGGYGIGGAVGLEAPGAAVPCYLFRYVDTEKVEPGKQYRYRVTLELANPNYDVNPNLLEDVTSAQKQTRWTPPVDSPVVSVPRDRKLFALSGKAHSQSLIDYSAHTLFHAWDQKMGAEVAKEFDLKLGDIADFVTTVENWYNPYTGMGENLDNYHFQFDEGPPMLADIEGGTPLPGAKGVEQPTELLFIDNKGRMFTSNQSRDAATAEFYKERYTLTTTPAAGEAGILAPEQQAGGRGGYGAGR